MKITEIGHTLADLGFWHLAGDSWEEKAEKALAMARPCFGSDASLKVSPDQGIPVVDVVEVGPTILSEVNEDEETVTVVSFRGLTGDDKKEIEQTALSKARPCVDENARLEMFYCVMYENEDADGGRYRTTWVQVAAVEPIKSPRVNKEIEPLVLFDIMGNTKKEIERNALIEARADEPFCRRIGRDTRLWVDFSEHGVAACESAPGLFVADGLMVWAVS
ncbi:hypothetical protein ACQPZP_43545 [Spirillospora sp. CA-142024]|uniref:hypothetical protein n=1 Tax=Spirillospora sp. CA-142024 TaxID=3240036 RepID=UPI003D90F18E